MDSATLYLVLACLFGFTMAWGVGANDVANAMGTSVGSKSLTIRQAILIAMIFEFLGALLAGGEVTDTLRKGILDTDMLAGEPEQFIFGMLACLLSAALWLGIATHYGWPVSTTHSIVGALIGFGTMSIGVQAVQWGKIGYIGLSWILSPVLGAVVGFTLYLSVQKLILNTADPFKNAKRYIPYYIFLSAFIIALVTSLKGLSHLGFEMPVGVCLIAAAIFASVFSILGIVLLRKIKMSANASKTFRYASVEKTFGILMLFTACAMAFAHGSNDVANAIGPMAAITNVVATGQVAQIAPIPNWVLFLGALGIVTGLLTYGHKVIATVGTGITKLTPSRGFAATLAAAAIVVVASGTGLPISTTHTLVGAVLGVGLVRGIDTLNFRMLRNIMLSWIVTLPAGAILAIVLYSLLDFCFL